MMEMKELISSKRDGDDVCVGGEFGFIIPCCIYLQVIIVHGEGVLYEVATSRLLPLTL